MSSLANVYVRNEPHARADLDAFTKTHVTLRSHNGRMAGKKPETFTPEENAELRNALKELKEREGWTQAELGDVLGIGQQGAGTLLRGGGFGRFTANKLALRFGYLSGDELLRARGAIANPMTVPRGWQTREMAIANARQLGYPEEVLRRVVVKYQETQYSSVSPRWWNDRIVNEAREQEDVAKLTAQRPPQAEQAREERPRPSKPPATSAKRQRKAG